MSVTSWMPLPDLTDCALAVIGAINGWQAQSPRNITGAWKADLMRALIAMPPVPPCIETLRIWTRTPGSRMEAVSHFEGRYAQLQDSTQAVLDAMSGLTEADPEPFHKWAEEKKAIFASQTKYMITRKTRIHMEGKGVDWKFSQREMRQLLDTMEYVRAGLVVDAGGLRDEDGGWAAVSPRARRLLAALDTLVGEMDKVVQDLGHTRLKLDEMARILIDEAGEIG